MHVASNSTATILVENGRVDGITVCFVGRWNWSGGDDVGDMSRKELFFSLPAMLAPFHADLRRDLPLQDSESVGRNETSGPRAPNRNKS